MKSISLLLFYILALTCAAPAQIIDRKVEEAKNKTNQRVDNRSSETIDKGLDKIEKGIGDIFKKKDKKKDKKKQPSGQSAPPATPSGDVPDFSDFKSTDFIPGKNVLFFEDFAKSSNQWMLNEWDRGDAEAPGITTLSGQPGYWYRMPRKGNFVPLPVTELPEDFTLEFDLYPDMERMSEMEGGLKTIFLEAGTDRKEYSFHFSEEPQIQLDLLPTQDFVYLDVTREYNPDERKLFTDKVKIDWPRQQPKHVSVSRKGTHIKLYIDGQKYIDLPNGLPKKTKYSLLFATNQWVDGLYFTNIRLATGIPQATEEIANAGKFATTSIYFDVNSSRIQAASWPALKNAAEAIKASGNSFEIVGHTDSDGNDENNLQLSMKRAEAVKQALVKEFGIQPGLLTSTGKGESQPAASNDSPSGKASNRRVEFIRQSTN